MGYGVQSYYGTFGQSGNAWEWNDAVLGAVIGAERGQRGGAYNNPETNLRSSARLSDDPTAEDSAVGFRVAMVVPEPATTSLLSMFGLALLARRRR